MLDSYASQYAVIKVPQAYVYTDVQKKSVIGYVRKGKRITVGEVARAKGTLLPILVSGKVAYIQLKDIYLAKDITRSAITSLEQDPKVLEMLKLQRFDHFQLSVGMQALQLGSQWDKASKQINRSNSSSMGTEFRLRLERQKRRKISYHFGGAVQSASDKKLALKAYQLEGGISYNLLHRNKHSLGPFLTLHYSPSTKLTTDSQTMSGTMFGVSLAGEYSYNFHDDWLLKAGVGFHRHTLYGFTKNTELNPEYMSLSGAHTYLAFALKF